MGELKRQKDKIKKKDIANLVQKIWKTTCRRKLEVDEADTLYSLMQMQ